jgi:hypothetical protein
VVLFGDFFLNNENSRKIFRGGHFLKNKKYESKNIKCYILVVG